MVTPNTSSIRKKAIGAGVFGFLAVVLVLNIMNGKVEFVKKNAPSQVQFETKKMVKKGGERLFKKSVAKKAATTTKSLKPRMNLALATSGLDLGVDILGLSSEDSRLLSQARDTVMTEDVVDRIPQVQYREAVPYPDGAKEQNINGHVTLNILVNKKGDVDQVKLLESQPDGVFDHVALQSVKTWTFSPAEYKGQFVSVWVKQTLKFQVN